MPGSIFLPKYRRKDGTVAQSAVYWVKYYDPSGRCIRESTETDDRKKAERFLVQKVAAAQRGEPVRPHALRVTVDEIVADVLTDYKVNGKRSLADTQRRWNLHLKPYFGGMRAAAVGTDTVRNYIARRQTPPDGETTGASNASINRELALLKRAFVLGHRSVPPKVMAVPPIVLLAEDNARRGFFEPEQFAAVRARLREPLQPVVTFAYLTGWRIRSEVLKLQWRQVDFDAHDGRGEVRLLPGTTKSGEGRTFVLTGELRALLEAQMAATDGVQRKQGVIVPWVFHRRGKPIRDFYTAWRNACRDAGCPGMIPHDFRRTAIRNLVRNRIPEKVAMALAGHATREVFDRYDITAGQDLVDAAATLDALAATVPATGKVGGMGKVTGKVRAKSRARLSRATG